MSHPYFHHIILFSLCGILSPLFAAESIEPTDDYETKARTALEQIVQEQIFKIKDKANNTESNHEDNIKDFVLSTHIRSFNDIGKNIDTEIQQLQSQIRLLIRHVATDIEISGGNSGALQIDENGQIHYQSNPNIPKNLDQKRETLLKANLQNSVSVRSAILAIKMLATINDSLKEQALHAQTRSQKERVYMTQAVYVYEMSSITLDLLNNLRLEGKTAIENLFQESQQRAITRSNNIQTQIDQAQALQQQGLLSPQALQKEQDSYALMLAANQQSLSAWDKLMKRLQQDDNFLQKLKKNQALIAYKRDKAKLQLETLRDLRHLAELRDVIGSLDELVATIADVDLLVLDEQTVRTLLGYNDADK